MRLRIEHAQILRVEDIEWMGRMGVIASFQPTHATSDMDYVEKRIGPRVGGAYAWQKILALVSFSDLHSLLPPSLTRRC